MPTKTAKPTIVFRVFIWNGAEPEGVRGIHVPSVEAGVELIAKRHQRHTLEIHGNEVLAIGTGTQKDTVLASIRATFEMQ